MWQELATNLANLIKEYQSLHEINERKHSALVRVSMEDLDAVLKEEGAAQGKVAKLEQERQAVIKKAMADNPKIKPEMKLVEMIALCPSQKAAEKLTKLHKLLLNEVDKVQKLVDDNNFLTQAALDAVQFRLNQLTGAEVQGGYGNTGGETVSHEKNFDFKA